MANLNIFAIWFIVITIQVILYASTGNKFILGIMVVSTFFFSMLIVLQDISIRKIDEKYRNDKLK